MKSKYKIPVSMTLLLVLLFMNIPTGSEIFFIKAQSMNENAVKPTTAQLTSENQLFLPLIAKNASHLPKLRIWTDPTRFDVMQEIASAYEAEHSVDVIVSQYDYLIDEFITAAPAGTGPDIIIAAHDRVGQLFGLNLISPIDLGEKEADFTPASLDAVYMNDAYYGLPFATENLAFFYNADLVTSPPTTWEEVHTLGQVLQASDDVTWGFVFSGTSYDVYPMMTANGGYVFGKNPDGSYNTDDLGIDSAGMIAFGELAKTWVEEGFLLDDTYWENARVLFETGEVPWLMTGPWSLENIRNSGINYAIADFPSGRPFSGVQTFMINAFSDNQALAASFLTDFVATTEVMLTLFDDGLRAPAYIPALEGVTDPDVKKIGEVGIDAEPMPNIPEMGCVWGPWGNALTNILNGEKTPTDAYTDAEAQIRECIDNPLTGMVNVPGSFQSEVGCVADWDPACALTALSEDGDLYTATFTIPAGDYECKVALDGTWDINYGLGGVPSGDNIPLTVATSGDVTFTYHPDTHILEIITP